MRATLARGLGVVALSAVVGALWVSTASAATIAVCSTCTYTTIQAAVNAAGAGDVITVAAGTYRENVTISTPVTIQGAGIGETVVEPAVSDPTCGDSTIESSLCVGASNVFLVQADDVTISGLTVNGNNPAISSGVAVGGSDIDARNGIIVNFNAGTFNDLTVSGVAVENVYLRGIYASSGGTFSFTGDTVANVRGNPASIAMFNFEGSGVFADNHVSYASDAISSNWSTGVQFLDNTITHSNSGIHTDNAGEFGSTDLIAGNRVSSCIAVPGSPDAYGIWVFAPYAGVTVQDNSVSGCTIGLGTFGSNMATTIDFNHNTVTGGRKTPDAANSIGAWVSTTEFGFGYNPVTATFENNLLRGFNQGFDVEQPNDGTSTPQATATFTANAIEGNAAADAGQPGTIVNAAGNWWGCKTGPGTGKCDSVEGTVTDVPWLTRAPTT